jgi:hypothetical protein
MKSIGELTPTVLDKARESKDEKNMLDPLSGQLVDKVFVKIALICRGFDSFYADRNRLNAEKTQWILAFTKLGLRNQSQIQPALNKLEFYRYPNPPQLGEFLEWRHCKPEDIGFPSVDEAYQMSILLNRQFSDYKIDDERVETVIRHAIRQIDSMTYRSMPIAKAKPAFEYNYTVSLRQFMEGKLEVIKKAISEKPEAHPSDKPRSDEARKSAMEAIRSMGINVKRTDDRGLQENPV